MSKSSREMKSDAQINNRFILVAYFLFGWLVAALVGNILVSLGLHNLKFIAIGIVFGFVLFSPLLMAVLFSLEKRRKDNIVIYSPFTYKLYKITDFLYSAKIQREIFKPIVADWQEEYFEALHRKEIKKAHWINVRYTYAFFASMWMKSPIGDLLEFISKLTKP